LFLSQCAITNLARERTSAKQLLFLNVHLAMYLYKATLENVYRATNAIAIHLEILAQKNQFAANWSTWWLPKGNVVRSTSAVGCTWWRALRKAALLQTCVILRHITCQFQGGSW